MANQKDQQGRPSMDEEKRQSGTKEQRESYKPEKQDKQQSEVNPGRNQNPGQQSDRH